MLDADHVNSNDNGDTGRVTTTSTVPWLQIVAECLLAVLVMIYRAYFLQYSLACNFVNMSMTILVAGALLLDSLRKVVAALALLTLYDGASVFGIPSVAHAVVDGAHNADAVSSTLMAALAMGSVAVQKLTSLGSSWACW